MSETAAPSIAVEAAGVPRARAMLERAQWAARSYARYDQASVQRIVSAVADAGATHARDYAEQAVAETGFGVVEHKTLKNVACSRGLVETYRGHDYVTPRIDAEARIVEVPRPAGVVLALTPSTNPVASVYFKTLLALMTRNAVVISPHPMAKACCSAAAHTLAEAASRAGAPDGVIQVVEEPSIPLINALMTDSRTNVIVATGGSPVVRAAYRSGNPAMGVGPGNVPVMVDRTADLNRAAKQIVDSKNFDHSILCSNESVLVVEEAVADRLIQRMQRDGAHLLAGEERDRVRDLLFPGGHFDTRVVGKSAVWLANEAGVRVPSGTRILLAPFELAVPEEALAHEKLCPVLGLVRVPSAARGIEVCRAILRITGEGHSASIHSTDPQTIMEFGAALRVFRVSVNVGNSLGSAGITTNLPPSMTLGTGFAGRSSLGENLQPKHLINWTRLAYSADAREPFADFTGLTPWVASQGQVPPYPVASNLDPQAAPAPPRRFEEGPAQDASELREEIRRLVIEELNQLIRS